MPDVAGLLDLEGSMRGSMADKSINLNAVLKRYLKEVEKSSK